MATLVCTILLDKTNGGAVTIVTSDEKFSQSICMNGSSVVIEVKDSQNTSTITQTADSVTIKCKKFLVDADTVTCKSTAATVHQSDDAMTLKSAKDMTLQSSANLAAQATSDLTGKGANVKFTANTEFSGAGLGASFKAASSTATVQGVTVKLAGSGELKGAAPLIELSATSALKASATGMLNINGGITSIAGSLIKIG